MDILSRLAFSPLSKSTCLKDDLLMIVRKQVGLNRCSVTFSIFFLLKMNFTFRKCTFSLDLIW
jgi:hypothetical protein